MTRFGTIAGWLLLQAASAAHSVVVPVDYPTIQAAVSAVRNGPLPSGTVIEVQAGTYSEAVTFADTNKSLSLVGLGGAAATVIDATGQGLPALTLRNASAAVYVEGFTFTGASAPVGGGIGLESASLILVDSIVEQNATQNDGGGIFVGDSTLALDGCTIQNNSADRAGGGMFIVGGSTVEMADSLVQGNDSGLVVTTGSGGGIQINDASLSMRNSQVLGNEGMFAGGGIGIIGIFGSPNGTAQLTVVDSEISGNSVAAGLAGVASEGGGINIEDNAELRLTRSHVHNNTADSGGALASFRATNYITDSILENNDADAASGTGGHGGAIHAISLTTQPSIVHLTRTLVRGNESVLAGGILVSGDGCAGAGSCGVLTIVDSLIEGNTAEIQGGGIHVSDATLEIDRSLILGNVLTNTTGGSLGGGLRILSSHSTITHSTIAGNTAGQHGGGIFVEGPNAQLDLSDSALYDNDAVLGDGGGGLYVGNVGPPTGTIQNNQIADNTEFQIREQSCPGGDIPAPLLTYLTNAIDDPASSEIYYSPCLPAITDIATFNALSPGSKTQGNTSDDPDFVSFLAAPRYAPSTLGWSVARAANVNIDEIGLESGPNGTVDVAPVCAMAYHLDTATAFVWGTGPPPPPPVSCSGQASLFDVTLSGLQVAEAGQTLDVEQVTVSSGATVFLRAGESVVIQSPFSLELGVTLTVDLDACLCE